MATRTVTFIFRPDVPPGRREAALAEMRSWASIRAAGLLNPKAKRPDVRRMGYVNVDDNANLQAMAERLSTLPEVEISGVAPRRGVA